MSGKRSLMMNRVKGNIAHLKKHVELMPDSNEKKMFQHIYHTLDNMRALVGDTRLMAGNIIGEAIHDMRRMRENREAAKLLKEKENETLPND